VTDLEWRTLTPGTRRNDAHRIELHRHGERDHYTSKLHFVWVILDAASNQRREIGREYSLPDAKRAAARHVADRQQRSDVDGQGRA
jgi:predicted GIY-YIG superfamily endonuclease